MTKPLQGHCLYCCFPDIQTDYIQVWVGFGMPTQALSPLDDLKATHVYSHGEAGDGEIIDISCDVIGSVVSLYLPTDKVLNICEVEAYGKL